MSGLIKCFNTGCRDFSRSEVNNCSRPLTRILECPEGVVRTDRGQRSEDRGQGKKAMSQVERDRIWYIKEFKSNECVCGGTKRPGSSFCYTCFKSLPSSYQGALYLKIGQGYEEAYENAMEWLTNNGEG
jgi:hypothetical protein